MKVQADKHRNPAPDYKVGQQVWLSMDNLRMLNCACKKLTEKWIGPYEVTRVTPNAVELKLPKTLRIHPVVNVSRVKPYLGPLPGQPVSWPGELWLPCYHSANFHLRLHLLSKSLNNLRNSPFPAVTQTSNTLTGMSKLGVAQLISKSSSHVTISILPFSPPLSLSPCPLPRCRHRWLFFHFVTVVTDFISSVIGIVVVFDGSFFTLSLSSPTFSSLS